MEVHHKTTRQLILDAALDIVETEGIKALTQPKIAKACGLRQSNLTYYFPRKADLYIALLEASHHRADRNSGGAAVSLEEMLSALFFDAERMRFFLSIVLEVGQDPELRSVLGAHAQSLSGEIARRLRRAPDDPNVQSFVDELRGIGLRAMMMPQPTRNRAVLLRAIAARHGISLSTKRAAVA